MGSASRIIFFFILPAVGMSVWTYMWPYGKDNICQCTEVDPVPEGETSNRDEFDTEITCLQAFSEDEFEFCEYEGTAVSATQCNKASSVKPGDLKSDNLECKRKCIEFVAGDYLELYKQFFEMCQLDLVVAVPITLGPRDSSDCEDTDGYTVAVLPDSCYSNYIWGFTNYDPSNAVHVSKTKYFEDVPSHVACQTLCQEVDDCAFFSWRAVPDLEARENGMQNPPDSCILYNQEFMDEITAFVVEDTFPPSQSDLCDMEQAAVCKTLPWEDGKFSLFSDYPCQTCDCQARCSWESPSHITGPAFCEKDVRETCTFKRPIRTSTLPPCEPLDDRTTAPEEGTAETDTALYTEPARARVDAETTNIIFSQGDPSSNELEGTAETDFTVLTETTIEMTTVELSSESTIELSQV